MAERLSNPGRLARLGLSAVVLFGGGATAGYVAARGGDIQKDIDNITRQFNQGPQVTMEVAGIPKNEDILTDPETLKLYESYVDQENFTELRPSDKLYDKMRIATWGMKYPGAPGGASVSYYVETIALGDFPGSLPQEDEDRISTELATDSSHSLPVGKSNVVPYKQRPRGEPYGTVIIPRKDVRVFVRTVGNVPAEYSLIPSELVEGSLFDGYYLVFDSYAGVTNDANDQGMGSVDGTPLQPTKEYENWRGSYYFDSDIIPVIFPQAVVLPKSSADTASK